MYNYKNSLARLTGNTTKYIKKTAITVIAFTTLTLGLGSVNPASANSSDSEENTTVYYVYLDDKYIGTVSDKEVVDKLMDKKVSEFKDTMDKKYKLSIGDDLTFVPEQVFHSSAKTNDKDVIKKLDEQLAVEAEATSIVVDGKAAVYVVDKNTANQVMEALKHKYVSNEEFAKLEKTKEAQKEGNLPPLQENESRLLDVKLSKEVSYSKEIVPTNEVLNVDEAVKYLTKGTLEEKKYTVKEGDVLGSIANRNGMTLQQFLSINPGLNENSVLQIGQKVNITAYQPVVEVITEKEVFKNEKISYKTQVKNDSSMFKGNSKVQQNGQEGLRQVTYKVSQSNGVQIKRETVTEKVIKEPVDKIVLKGTKVVPSRGTGKFVWPTVGGYISSYQGYRWGKFHKGIDIARPSNRTIKAADNGVVTFAGWDGSYGNKIIIDHRNGFRTVYAHLSSINVGVGQTVSRGSKIGVMGTTGNSTGVHLHFEVYKNGALQNPMSYL